MITFEAKGIADLERNLAALGPKVRKASEQFVFDVSAHAAERAQANAPILNGDLRRSIQPDPVVTTPDGAKGDVHASVPYALLQHEILQPFGAGPFQLGPISGQQPTTKEGGVGGKYLERVFHFHFNSYQNALANLIRSILPPGSSVQPIQGNLDRT